MSVEGSAASQITNRSWSMRVKGWSPWGAVLFAKTKTPTLAILFFLRLFNLLPSINEAVLPAALGFEDDPLTRRRCFRPDLDDGIACLALRNRAWLRASSRENVPGPLCLPLEEVTEVFLEADAVCRGPHFFLMLRHEARELAADVLLELLVLGLDVIQHVGQLLPQPGQRRLLIVEGEIVVDGLPGLGQNQIELVDRRVLVVDGELVGDAVLRFFDLLARDG